MLSLQQGGYMTLAQFAMIFWHDLAAPILAGIIPQRLSAGGVTGSKAKTGVRLP
ncbi:toxin Ldr, type I toxin-antitoxin system family protein [Escherichia coli MP021017.12]|nr:toxin Ldr, type I toxin-antitoxin system family protein [Escherichia coli MP021017.12]